MLRNSDTDHVRKVIAGTCMILAPLLVVAAAIIAPSASTDEARQLALVAENRDAFYISTLLGMLSLLFGIPAVLGVMHLLREKCSTEGHWGGAFALIGLMAFLCFSGIQLAIWQMAAEGANPAEMTALLERITSSTGIFAPVYLATFAMPLGFAILAMGLARANIVHPVMALCVAAGAIAIEVGSVVANDATFTAGAITFFIGLASTGDMVLLESDTEWEHQPVFPGIRHLLGIS